MRQTFEILIPYKKYRLKYTVTVLWRTLRLIRFKVDLPGKGYYELNYLAAQKNNRWKIRYHNFAVKQGENKKFGEINSAIFATLEQAMRPPALPTSNPKNNTPGTDGQFKKAIQDYQKAIEDWERFDYWTKM